MSVDDGGRVALVLVSHSDLVARGTADIAAQMAPDVRVLPAGGRPDGGIGTDFDRVQTAIEEGLSGAPGVVVLADLGSAVLTVESVVEFLDDDDQARVRLSDAPIVEGAVAASVAAQGGGSVEEVLAAAATAGGTPVAGGPADADGTDAAPGAGPGAGPDEGSSPDGVLRASATLRNPLGLHARPAAELARLAAGFDADVTVAGVEAASVLELMALGATGGQELAVTAAGPQAAEALAAVTAAIDGGFGEA